mgnify:CR=1 FL=1
MYNRKIKKGDKQMNKIIIEVGSTCLKIDNYEKENFF